MPRLYVVGLGPGDPELVTVKAAETLRRASIVFLPYSTGTNRSLAHSIVARYIGDAEVVFLGFPMGRDPEREVLVENARVVCHGVRRRGAGVFAVLGDPALYSTFHRLRPYLAEVCPELEVEVVPGVAAALACVARVVEPLALGDEGVALVPATRGDLVKKAVEVFDTVVIYKANMLDEELLREAARRREVIYARRCFMEGEDVRRGAVGPLEDYFTVIILRRRG